jgi:hypothetical protein
MLILSDAANGALTAINVFHVTALQFHAGTLTLTLINGNLFRREGKTEADFTDLVAQIFEKRAEAVAKPQQ